MDMSNKQEKSWEADAIGRAQERELRWWTGPNGMLNVKEAQLPEDIQWGVGVLEIHKT